MAEYVFDGQSSISFCTPGYKSLWLNEIKRRWKLLYILDILKVNKMQSIIVGSCRKTKYILYLTGSFIARQFISVIVKFYFSRLRILGPMPCRLKCTLLPILTSYLLLYIWSCVSKTRMKISYIHINGVLPILSTNHSI